MEYNHSDHHTHLWNKFFLYCHWPYNTLIFPSYLIFIAEFLLKSLSFGYLQTLGIFSNRVSSFVFLSESNPFFFPFFLPPLPLFFLLLLLIPFLLSQLSGLLQIWAKSSYVKSFRNPFAVLLKTPSLEWIYTFGLTTFISHLWNFNPVCLKSMRIFSSN